MCLAELKADLQDERIKYNLQGGWVIVFMVLVIVLIGLWLKTNGFV